jgi:hypothetical protein
MEQPIKRVQIDLAKSFRWPGPFENWSRAWVRKNFWRVRTYFLDEEDAVQACGEIFARCLKYYAKKVDNPAWMMSLFKVAVMHDWNTYSQKDGQLRIGRDPAKLLAHLELMPQPSANYGPLLIRWREASDELRQAMKILADAPAEMWDIVFSGRSAAAHNLRLRRLCGIRKNVDLLGELRALLS